MEKKAKIQPMTMGQRIREVRTKKGYTLADLSKVTKLTSPQISNYENDELQPNTKILVKLAEHLDTTTDYLSRGIQPAKIEILDGLPDAYKDKALDYIKLLKSEVKLNKLLGQLNDSLS